jgi:tight adherence protein B
LPFAMGFYMYIVNTKMMSLLWTDPFGIKLLWSMLAIMVIGVYWMRRVIRIHI